MAITATVVGSYPKPPEEGRPFVVRKTLHAIERGEATERDLVEAQDDLVAEIIAEQEGAGIGIVTDGHARWDDILTPFASRCGGFEIGPLFRWFDNNVYYRRPVCTGPISASGPASVETFTKAARTASKPVKAVIPGPVSFAHLSLDEHYYDHAAFVTAIAAVLADEVAALEEAGAAYIQIDEPALLGAPEDISLATEAIGTIASRVTDAELSVVTYFGDAKRLGADLFALPVTTFGLDLVSGPENLNLIPDLPSDRKLQVGIVDARNTRLEAEADLRATIERITSEVPAERLYLAPSCGLEFLPREKAKAKLELLGRIAKEVGE